ncbi:MAG: peptide ABC transporter substrate-binding protein [Pseudonocardiaceae bacterium]|nr:peptide ABC transporter substrate-binding protein [Pseudonocardiaceae bacterium]
MPYSRDAAAPGPPDQLRIAVEEDFGPLNILNQSNDPLTFLVYDRLVAPSPYAEEPQPWLATEVRDVDPRTWRISLREDVTWHDGEPFTADDVAFTIEWFKEVPSGTYSHHITTVPHIEQLKVLGTHELELTCGFNCPFLGSVTLAHVPIMPEHIWSTIEDPERHDDLLMPIIPSPSTTFTARQTGEIDAATQFLPPELVDQFSNSDDIEVATTTPLQFPELRINFQRAPFDNPEFRRALSAAIDRQELHEDVWLGSGRPADRGYPHPDSPWTDPDLRTPYEPQTTRRILDGLGFTDTDGDGVREGPDGPLSYRIYVDNITAHGVADPTQFIMSHYSGYLWDLPEVPYPEFEALFEEWKATETIDARAAVSSRMQQLCNEAPTSIPLHYPSGEIAYWPEAYDGWVESPGYGLVHKWSLLPREVAKQAGAVVEPGR